MHEAGGWAQAGETGTREKEHLPLLTVWMVRGAPGRMWGVAWREGEVGGAGPEEGQVVLILQACR